MPPKDRRSSKRERAIFDDIERMRLADERDEAQRDLQVAQAALRRIATGADTLTNDEQRCASTLGLPGDTTDPALVIARCALAITGGEDGPEEPVHGPHRVEPCPTVPLELDGKVVSIDAGIAPLVLAMNKLPGVRTLWSCEGHPYSALERRPYVVFEYGGHRLEILVEADQLGSFSDLVSTLAQRLACDADSPGSAQCTS